MGGNIYVIRQFDSEVAKVVGSDAATLLENIAFWVRQNAMEGKNTHEGQTWMFDTAEALSQRSGYLSPSQVRRALDKLVKNGYIIEGCFNKRAYDKTKWFTLTEKCPERLFHEGAKPNDDFGRGSEKPSDDFVRASDDSVRAIPDNTTAHRISTSTEVYISNTIPAIILPNGESFDIQERDLARSVYYLGGDQDKSIQELQQMIDGYPEEFDCVYDKRDLLCLFRCAEHIRMFGVHSQSQSA